MRKEKYFATNASWNFSGILKTFVIPLKQHYFLRKIFLNDFKANVRIVLGRLTNTLLCSQIFVTNNIAGDLLGDDLLFLTYYWYKYYQKEPPWPNDAVRSKEARQSIAISFTSLNSSYILNHLLCSDWLGAFWFESGIYHCQLTSLWYATWPIEVRSWITWTTV